jgi:hypothetical protein
VLSPRQEAVLHNEIRRTENRKRLHKENENEKKKYTDAKDDQKAEIFLATIAYEQDLLGKEKEKEVEEKQKQLEGQINKRKSDISTLDLRNEMGEERTRKKNSKFADFVRSVNLDGPAADDEEEEVDLDFGDSEWNENEDD